mmetsp:Transcript_123702/g.335932  ORF Transcript_123702/g.335932 Transcript_123702/m.335932 type:complete len:95 (+) Transcript_123702:180-464(+)
MAASAAHPICEETGAVFDTLLAMALFVLGYVLFSPSLRLALACAFGNTLELLLPLLPGSVRARVPKVLRAATPRATRTGALVVPMVPPCSIVHA